MSPFIVSDLHALKITMGAVFVSTTTEKDYKPTNAVLYIVEFVYKLKEEFSSPDSNMYWYNKFQPEYG